MDFETITDYLITFKNGSTIILCDVTWLDITQWIDYLQVKFVEEV